MTGIHSSRSVWFSVVFAAFSLSAQPRGQRLGGEVTLKSGSKIPFTHYGSGFAGEKLPYAENLGGMKTSIDALNMQMVYMSGVARIDFLNFSDDDQRIVQQRKLFNVRKATVTFRNGTTKQNTFLYVESAGWAGPNERGTLENILSLTLHTPSAIAPIPLSGWNPESFSGEIVYTGGKSTSFNTYWSTLAGENLPYSEEPNEMTDLSLRLPQIRMPAVSRIDFQEMTEGEKKTLKQNKASSARKANVTLRDGTKKQNIFLDLALAYWKGRPGPGEVQVGDLADERLASIVFK